MRTKLLLLTLILAVAGGAVFYDMQQAPPVIVVPEKVPAFQSVAQGEILPNLTLQPLEGGSVTFQELEGKIVLLNFWASWCAPCLKEFPSMMRLLQQMPDELVMVAISVDENKNDMVRFLKRFSEEYRETLQSPQFIAVWDENKQLAQDVFHTLRFPETIIIDRNGVMRRKITGDTEWDAAPMLAYLRGLQDSQSR